MSDKAHAIVSHPEHAELPERMSPIVAAGMRMLQANPDPAALRELLAIHREWEHEEARKAFERAMVALKRDLPAVLERDKVVDFTNKAGVRTFYRHTSLAAVVDAVIEHLTKHGFSHSWTPQTNERQIVSVTCRITHVEGHSKETTISAPVDTSGNKSSAQGVASTITLLQRYTLLALLGLATADMQDPEPSDEPRSDGVDTARNLRAMGRLQKLGKTKQEAEEFVGRPVAKWTAADIDALKAWVEPQRQPGDD